MTTPVSFVDLRAQHEEVRPQIEAAFQDILNRSAFIGGSYVSTFEKDFAQFLGVSEVVGCGNGTDALWLSLAALEIGPGDAVITQPNTFIATVEAITRSGALPLFVEIDLQTALIDFASLKKFLVEQCRREDNGRLVHLASRTTVKAIMPVHLYGLPVDMEKFLSLANEFGLKIVEDACQAHGAMHKVKGELKRAGSLGAAAGFSFYPGKNLGAMGDAGAAATNDPELASKMRWLRDHGSSEKYVHAYSNGWNARLDSLQAAVLGIKLKKLDEWNDRRRAAAAHYQEELAGLPLALPIEPDYARHIYHLYIVRAESNEKREMLRKELSARGIGVGLHYPIPLHLQKAYETMGFKRGDFPISEESAETGLSLPMHQALTVEQIHTVADACREILG